MHIMNKEALMKVKLTEEQKESMSYADVAFMILNNGSKKVKIQDLFKKVIKAMGLPEEEFERSIGDFFDLLLIDKRFIMLENGFCDLKINHSTRIVFDEDEDDDIDIIGAIEEEPEAANVVEEINYDENSVDDDTEDGLENLVIVDTDEDENDMD